MRSLVMLLITAVLLACGTREADHGQANRPNATLSPDTDLLLAYAATDFQTRGPRPIRFRDVRSGYVMTDAGTKQYRLCGQVLAVLEGNEPDWIAFSTVQTSPYEQWIGGQAAFFCTDAAMTWDKGDLSSSCRAESTARCSIADHRLRRPLHERDCCALDSAPPCAYRGQDRS